MEGNNMTGIVVLPAVHCARCGSVEIRTSHFDLCRDCLSLAFEEQWIAFGVDVVFIAPPAPTWVSPRMRADLARRADEYAASCAITRGEDVPYPCVPALVTTAEPGEMGAVWAPGRVEAVYHNRWLGRPVGV
jgi:hypothetical protein